MRQSLDALRHALQCGDPRIAALASVSSAVWWCASLSWPDASFDRAAYAWMRSVMPEAAWAGLFGALALAQAMALGRPRQASWLALIAAVVWTFSGLSWAAHNFPPPSASMGGHFTVALLAWWEWVRRDGR